MVENWAVPIGAGIAFFGGAIACGWAQSRIGAAGAGTVAEKPKMTRVSGRASRIIITTAVSGFSATVPA
ncbi:MAG TPA: ATPase, partial [Methanoregulaceae archaeon]|nr:ATPase [Methanoregulaceae archaeon]